MIKILNGFQLLDELNLTTDENDILTNISDYDNIITLLKENFIEYVEGTLCSECGEFIPDGEEYTDYNGNIICETCINDYYFYCNDCDEYYRTDDNDYIVLENGDYVCQSCSYDYYCCDSCGEWVYTDESYYDEDTDRNYCCTCYNEMVNNRCIYSYHSFNNWQEHKTPKEKTPPFYIGFELEIDNGQDKQEAARYIRDNLPCICMQDGSLGYNGIEIISHPLSHNYMKEHKHEFERVFNTLVNDYGYRSHDTNTCGLHFHITRPDEKTIDRLLLFMETYRNELITFSRRTESDIQHWSNFLTDIHKGENDKVIKSIEFIKKDKYNHNRYMALNLTNEKTIEFRFCKGTLKFETFMACYELVYYLTKMARDKKTPLKKLTWQEVTSNGDYLKEYVKEHNINTDRNIIDYTRELQKERTRELNEIKKQLERLHKKIIKEVHQRTDTKKYNEIKSEAILQLAYILNDIESTQNTIKTNKENKTTDILDIKYIKSITENYQRQFDKAVNM